MIGNKILNNIANYIILKYNITYLAILLFVEEYRYII